MYLVCPHLYGVGTQDIQRMFHEALPANPSWGLLDYCHQALHQEHILCGEERNHRQLPCKVSPEIPYIYIYLFMCVCLDRYTS